MSKYNNYSDFEINKLICAHLPVMVEDDQNDTDSTVMVNDIVSMYPIDPVNDWSIMGSLIIEHGVSLISTRSGYEAYCWGKGNPANPPRKSNANENPLRAAAICIILKLESEA